MAFVVAVACAAYPVVAGSNTTGIPAFAGLIGVAMVLAGLLGAWEDGLALGPTLIVVGYALSLAPGNASLDRGAPLVAVGLLATVELGSWSLELRDGPEARRLAHLGRIVLLLVGALAVSLLVLAAGSVLTQPGLPLFALGAIAAFGLFALLVSPIRKGPR